MTKLLLTREDLLSPSIQDKNAGNSGDLVKHTAYLALLRELARTHDRGCHIVEAHGGKGVYVSAHRHLIAARQLPGYRHSALGLAQSACFDPSVGLGSIVNLRPGETAYAGSGVLHARAIRDGGASSLTLLDCDPGVRTVADRVFGQPCFSTIRSRLRVDDPMGLSETMVLSQLKDGAFAATHVLHFDPFSFVMAQDHSATRTLYRDIVRECDASVHDGRLAAASLFFTWGSNGAAAREDLHGDGYLGGLPGGYRDLLASVDPTQRVVVRWCWELFFSLLVIVPRGLKAATTRALEADVAWLTPQMREMDVC